IAWNAVRAGWAALLAVRLPGGAPRTAEGAVRGSAAPAERESQQVELNAAADAHWRTLVDGDVPAIVRFHATEGFRAKWDFQFGAMGRGYQTFGLFLLG